MDKSGSGDEIFSIDLGEVGRIYLEDDSDQDSHAYVYWEFPDGNSIRFGRTGLYIREEMGDDDLEAYIDDYLSGSTGTTTSAPTQRRGRFICDDCGLTWPGARNQTPDGPTDTCPECDDQ